ncbi:hypothetical protein ACM0CQ_08520 [Mycobacteroides abscessus subsp. abscessus]|uniref:hypothetical protein n=1 Tax=Mycobacteroides abscessus TaxID=36809 RepID=UPI0011C45638|nr:hypothetical protein [Mycobacteroides abscessus]MBN7434173.1 hypothetical protein [Mycobacteroides abscessus subsp. abscessus]
MSVWERLGFRENLYATPPLPGSEEGSRLLVGRDAEVEELQDHWASYDTHASVEGANGVGKTSLVAVAAYRDMVSREAAKKPLIIPLSEIFQLTSESEGFENKVYLALARALLENEDRLSKSGYSVADLSGLRQWLDSPTNKTRSVSGTVLGFGGGGTYGVSANTSAGFSQNGLIELVNSNLRNIFPSRAAGGFVGVLDNMELLSTSKDARRRLEEMRDGILNIPGVRWVLCGANGIVRSAVGSPRLTGRISEPLRLAPLQHESVPEVIRRRINEYRTRDDADPPVDPDGFRHLYTVLNNNLRIALKHAEEFTKWYVKNAAGSTAGDRAKLLEIWLTEQADSYAADAGALTPRTWKLFDDLIEFGGSCSPSEFDYFEFSSNAAMRPYVKALEEANLVNSAIDEDDSRRRTIEITPNGWLVHYKRSGYRGQAETL